MFLARTNYLLASLLTRHRTIHRGLRVGIGPPPAAKGLDNVDKTAVVLDPPLGSAGLLLLLLLGVNLRRLAANLACTSEGAVDLERTILINIQDWSTVFLRPLPREFK